MRKDVNSYTNDDLQPCEEIKITVDAPKTEKEKSIKSKPEEVKI